MKNLNKFNVPLHDRSTNIDNAAKQHNEKISPNGLKKILTLLMAIFFVLGGCNGQKNKNAGENKKEEMKDVTTTASDSTTNPRVNVKVTKKYDDKGNLIRFDSSYSYVYTSPNGEVKTISSDSLFGDFKSFYNKKFGNYLDKGMNDIFFNDSLLNYDFLNDNYFRSRFDLNKDEFEKMFQQMDSMKADFMRSMYPQGKIKKKD